MRVKLVNKKLMNDDFLPLKLNKAYYVACIDINLVNGRRFIYIYEESNLSPHPFCYLLEDFKITDSSIPDDWVSRVFIENITTPSLICAPPFIADQDFYIALHDLNLEPDQEQQVIDYIQSQQ